MKAIIALYKHREYEWIRAVESDCEATYAKDPDYIRMTEWTEIDLPEADRGEATREAVNALDEQIKEVQTQAQLKLNDLQRQKQELLALTVAA